MHNTVPETLEVPVKYGACSLCGVNGTLGINIDGDHLNDPTARHYFVASRIEVTLEADPNAGGDIPGQQVMDEAKGSHSVKVIADVKSVSLKRSGYSASLCFHIDQVNGDHLKLISKQSGKMTAIRVGEAGQDADPPEDDPDQQSLEDAA